jgi:hypothetical protein
MRIIPEINHQEALKEYLDHNPEKAEADFNVLWDEHPKSIRIIYGWLLAYQDVLDWFAGPFNQADDIHIYPAFTKNACSKGNKVFYGVKKDYNHDLDFGVIIHELCHILYKLDETKTEEVTKEIVEQINEKFHLNINHS